MPFDTSLNRFRLRHDCGQKRVPRRHSGVLGHDLAVGAREERELFGPLLVRADVKPGGDVVHMALESAKYAHFFVAVDLPPQAPVQRAEVTGIIVGRTAARMRAGGAFTSCVHFGDWEV